MIAWMRNEQKPVIILHGIALLSSYLGPWTIDYFLCRHLHFDFLLDCDVNPQSNLQGVLRPSQTNQLNCYKFRDKRKNKDYSTMNFPPDYLGYRIQCIVSEWVYSSSSVSPFSSDRGRLWLKLKLKSWLKLIKV